ncbi:MAG: penicillin-binding protein 2 [Alistipes sp.]|nr:penicillin-binding protein 2 [Alistipes sp.]MBR5584851.1 penicillin-binding protein 2 [Alistipes sp.]
MSRYKILQILVGAIGVIILIRLFSMQILSDEYDVKATKNIVRTEVEYPMRGEVLDRNGEYLVKSRVCYDVMVIYREIPKTGFDTMRLATILEITPEALKKKLKAAALSPRAPTLVTNYLSQDNKLLLDEGGFKGFHTRFRTAREYPRKIGGNLLGYVSEVRDEDVRKWEYYEVGDYIGVGGVESAYEAMLRGEKGVSYRIYDSYGALKGEYNDGMDNILPVKGSQLTSTIDARLQEFAEELMVGKIGAVVAIEPSTGEILVMVSSPTYDPDLMVGRQRNNNYAAMLHNQRQPQFNRAVKAKYPPGSTFKLVQGLIGLQEGVLKASDRYPCSMGFSYGSRKMACHAHSSPLNLRDAVAHSCNAYFCYVFRDMITNSKYGSVKEGVRVWNDYVYSFGFGRKLGTDQYGEGTGYVPTPEYYDKGYNNSWNWGTVISCAIGQGEMGCTPLQMANLAAIVANRGYYYIPHIIKKIEGRDSIDSRFYERQYTLVDSIHFVPIVEGMWRGVNVAGTSGKARLEGWDVCGKTGTAQNPNGADHSTFLSFAPKDNPKIAISVYVEHGGFGASIALPIASLIEELYLTDTITRPKMVEDVLNFRPNYTRNYDAKQQRYDQKRQQSKK